MTGIGIDATAEAIDYSTLKDQLAVDAFAERKFPDLAARKSEYQDVTFDPATPENLPSYVRRMPEADRIAWCANETIRQATVTTCLAPGCGRQLKDGEQIPHNLRHASNGRVRSAAGTVLNLTPEEAREAVALAAMLLDEVK